MDGALTLRWCGVGYRFPDYDKRATSVLNPSEVNFSSCVSAQLLCTDIVMSTELTNSGRAGRGGQSSPSSCKFPADTCLHSQMHCRSL